MISSGPVVFPLPRCVLGILFAVGVSVAGATDITVNTTSDQFDTPSGPEISLREAIRDANATPANDTIILAAEVYALTLTGAGEEASATGDLDIAASATSGTLTIRGISATGTILDGRALGDRVFHLQAGGELTLEDLAVTGGDASQHGGGALVSGISTSLTATRCRFDDNTAADDGGAIYNGSGGSLSLTDSMLGGNLAGGAGGAIANTGMNSTLSLTRSTIHDNGASGGHGGAIHNDQGAMATLANATITDNSAAVDGGGIRNADGASLIIQNATVADNVSGGAGGGVFNDDDAGGGVGNLTLENTIVSGNSTAASGPDLAGPIQTIGGVNLFLDVGGITAGLGTEDADYLVGDPLLSPLSDFGGEVHTRHPLDDSPAIQPNATNADTVSSFANDARGSGFPRVVNSKVDIGAVEAGLEITVTSRNDSGAGTLRQAIADASTPGHRITFSLGSLPVTSIRLTSQLVIDKSLFLDASASPGYAVIDAQGVITDDRVLEIAPGGHTVVMETLTVTGGKPTGAFPVRGGGILNNGGSLTLNHVIVSDNAVELGQGGGIFNDGASASVTLNHSTLSDNDGNLTGGGIYNLGAAVTLRNSIVSGNIAGSGPGIYNFTEGSRIFIADTTFSGNTGLNGGGLQVVGDHSSVSIRNSTFSANSATQSGGAFLNSGSFSAISLEHTTFSGNSADHGGGILNSGNSTLDFHHVTISGNRARTEGGGIRNSAAFAALNLNNVIVAGNTSPSAPDLYNYTSTLNTAGVNLLSDLAESDLTEGPSVLLGDPNLGPLGRNGGPIQTRHPRAGSPAIDPAGTDTTSPFANDARGPGFPRVVSGKVDIGAVEAGPAITVTSAADPGAGSLRQAILDAEPGSRILFDPGVFPDTITLVLGQLTVDNSLFLDASNIPGGVSIAAGHRVVEITDNTAGPNHAVVFDNFSISGQRTTQYGGGFFNSGDLTLNHTGVTAESTGAGGGIYNNLESNLALNSSTISGSSASLGAGIYNNRSIVELDASIISENSGNSGGGIYNFGGDVTLNGSTVAANTATHGDGGGVNNSKGGTLTLSNATLSGNSAASEGGGVYCTPNTALYINSSTLSLNSASEGGGIFYEGSAQPFSLHNSIVGGNTATIRPDILLLSGRVIVTGVNLVKNTSGADLVAFKPGVIIADPLLTPLGNYGGLVFTMLPRAGSPVIDPAGGLSSSPFANDARGAGFDRVVNSTLDIGAVEASPPITVTNTDDSGVGSLRQAIADSEPGTLVNFDAGIFPATITLTSGELAVDNSIMIDASLIDGGVTVSGNQNSRVFSFGEEVYATLESISVVDGQDLSGGGILNAGVLDFSGGVISGNTATNEGGGVKNTGALKCDSVTLAENAAANGAGIYSAGSSSLALQNLTLSENSATSDGGGLYAAASSELRVENVTLFGNEAFRNGGGIFHGGPSPLLLGNVTVSRNTASTAGGGVFNGGATAVLNLLNTIVAENEAPSGPDIRNDSGTINPTGVNLLADLSGSGLVAGATVLEAAPLLGPFGHYGGPVRTLHPLAISPAIDPFGGIPPASLDFDARGPDFDRFVNGRVDIGAVEAQLMATVSNTNDSGAGSLREALADVTGSINRIGFTSGVDDPIVLTSGPLLIDDTVFIDASNLSNGVTIDANGASRVVDISPGDHAVVLESVTLTGGNASGPAPANRGGAIFNQGNTLTLNNSTLSNNSAAQGAGIDNMGGTIALYNSTLSGNDASGDGGGIFNEGGTAELNQVTLSDNSAVANGGGIFNGGVDATLILTNSIVAANSAAGGPDLFNTGTVSETSGVNLFEDLADSGLTAGATILEAAPQLGPLGDNGRGFETMAPLPGSPAIDAGLRVSITPSDDQRGVHRPIDGDENGVPLLDIGAVEVLPPFVSGVPDGLFRHAGESLELSWNDSGAPAYRVYLGTDRASVAGATPGSGQDLGLVSANVFDPGALASGTRFFWRVESVFGGTEVPNPDVFEFSTITPQADARIGKKAIAATHKLDDVYTATGTGQIVRVKLKGRRKAKFHLSFENDGDNVDAITAFQTRSDRKVRLTSFLLTGPRQNVTAALVVGNFQTSNLDPGEIVLIQTQAKPKKTRIRKTVICRGTSVFDPTVLDTVLGKLKSAK